MEYYVSIKRTASTAIVTHVCNEARAKMLIDDWHNNFLVYEFFQVLKK